jgi:hypothetical protein
MFQVLFTRWLRRSLCLVALAGPIALSAQVQPQTLIGILEDNPGQSEGESHYRAVRLVFRRDRAGWSNCLDQRCVDGRGQADAPITWTVAFDGKLLARIASRSPSAPSTLLSAAQQQEIIGDAAPTVGKPSTEFAGFLFEAVHRPLVTVTAPNYRDPDSWKPGRLRSDAALAVRTAFRKRFPKVENCTSADQGPRPWSYLDTNIKLNKAYASKGGWLIAEVVLKGSKCDGPPDEPFWSHWFVVTPERQIRFLDSNMLLVDAGDYDNDGRSELVFSINGYNRGGYKLFYDDFRRKAVFEFSYH